MHTSIEWKNQLHGRRPTEHTTPGTREHVTCVYVYIHMYSNISVCAYPQQIQITLNLTVSVPTTLHPLNSVATCNNVIFKKIHVKYQTMLNNNTF